MFLGIDQFYFEIIVRMVLAVLLGGVIGYERESMNRPAGFRTHILVCVGAALVMLTSEFVFNLYKSKGVTNIDPARLGAQVISGIGFLGAGTIIRDGFNIRGLTTAASLWAVSCVGIAVGIGFYEGAFLATLIIYLTLMLLRNIEKNFAGSKQFRTLCIESENIPNQIGLIGTVFGRHNVIIKNIEFINNEGDTNILIKFQIKMPHNVTNNDIINELQGINGILKVYEN